MINRSTVKKLIGWSNPDRQPISVHLYPISATAYSPLPSSPAAVNDNTDLHRTPSTQPLLLSTGDRQLSKRL
ncbi:MAG: hypothetical protein PHP23_10090 [Desulfobacterales bacterium]|nr:hypothetical protein [Desulfobacterales bacterium]MDD4072657.1 hypothetical protein [Desulfobacterales bacterium]MDD4391766.1 hypothetical protein [Desulfobacterales bacterium]